jgi:hypothetical protein
MRAPEEKSLHTMIDEPDLQRFFVDIGTLIERDRPTEQELICFFAETGELIKQAEVKQRELDKTEASGFNVFSLIEPDENKLSDILADMLDPKGTHGQGNLFLRLLFKKLGFDSTDTLTKSAVITREARTHGIEKYRRKIDVLIEAGVLVAIENKVDSPEQTDQVKDYLDHLRYCTRRHSVRSVLIYLTPDGQQPMSLRSADLKRHQESGELNCWSYRRELRGWLEACINECKAQRFICFISDFIGYIESALKRNSEINQEDDDGEER